MVKTIESIKEEIEENWADRHFSIPQRDFLIELLLKLKPNYCLETGFCTGSSSSTILAASNPTKHISLGLDHNNYEIAKNLQDKYNFTFLEGYSEEILSLEFYESNYPEGIDFYHVDGGHCYSTVLSDLETAFPNMNKGFVILVDDYNSIMCPCPDVDRAVDEFVNKNNLSKQQIRTEDGKGMAMIKSKYQGEYWGAYGPA